VITKEELDKSWEGIQQLKVTCSDGRIINARHGNKRNASILLECFSDDGEKYVLYFNAISNKKRYAVKHNSKFAHLYRLVVGVNPVKRYSHVEQLIKHLVGYEIHVQKSEVKYDNGSTYNKIILCSPVKSRSSTEWDKTGRLKPKTKKRLHLKPIPKEAAHCGFTEDLMAKNCGFTEDLLRIGNGYNTYKCLVHSDNIQRNNLTAYQSNDVHTPVNKTINNNPVESKRNVTYHKRNKGEAIEDYYDRVIDETF